VRPASSDHGRPLLLLPTTSLFNKEAIMENALCIEDGVIYNAVNFALSTPEDIARKRRLLQCPECEGPAFFRNVSFNGQRIACFGARPHADGCSMTAYDQTRTIYDAIDEQDIIDRNIIVDFGYGSPLSTQAGWNINAESGVNNFVAPWPDSTTHRRLSSLLRLLVDSPTFKNSNQLIEAHNQQRIPARDFFVPLLDATRQHAGQLRGYWGMLSDAKLVGNTLWLNSGKHDTISFVLDIIFVEYFTRRFHIDDLEDLAGALILVIGTPSIAKNGKLYYVIEDIEFVTLRLT